jgi:hypothetical protein
MMMGFNSKRTGYRGFIEKTNTEGYKKVTDYLKKNIDSLENDFE